MGTVRIINLCVNVYVFQKCRKLFVYGVCLNFVYVKDHNFAAL